MIYSITMRKKQDMASLIRQTVKRSRMSRRALCRVAGVDCGGFSRFMTGEHGLTLDSVEKLAGPLGLKLIRDTSKG